VVPVAALLLLAPFLGSAAPNGSQPRAATVQQTPPPQGGTQGQGAGQRPPTRQEAPLGWEWWKDDAVKKELGLTDRQVAQITRIYEDRSRQVKPYSDEYQKQIEELDRMTRERTVDTPTYALQVSRVEALRSKLNETRLVMFYSFYRLLSPEQNKKLQDIRDRRRSGRGGH
jgi:Spy/CpxP family protein refolding chaperone